MPRIIILGCGTGVGKTHVSRALLSALAAAGRPSIGLKPIETGITSIASIAPASSDAAALSLASNVRLELPHPLYGFAEPISPHLAARRNGTNIELTKVLEWVELGENSALHAMPHRAPYTLVESAGGVFSPISAMTTNFDLARALEPAIWVLVAADALGVLHDVTATLEAMRARGRVPDHVVLSAARTPDVSTGTNAAELAALGIVSPSAVLARDDDRGIDSLVRVLLAQFP